MIPLSECRVEKRNHRGPMTPPKSELKEKKVIIEGCCRHFSLKNINVSLTNLAKNHVVV